LVNLPLDVGYAEELAGTKTILSGVADKRVFSSPLLRCISSAEYVCPGEPIEIVEELRAYHSGEFEHRTISFVEGRHAAYAALTFREKFLTPQYGEESVREQARRVEQGLLQVLGSGTPTAVVVCHYSTINIIAHLAACNWDLNSYAGGDYDVSEGGLLRLRVDAPRLTEALGAGTPAVSPHRRPTDC
jgi:broad specificity phosphatase PhoE